MGVQNENRGLRQAASPRSFASGSVVIQLCDRTHGPGMLERLLAQRTKATISRPKSEVASPRPCRIAPPHRQVGGPDFDFVLGLRGGGGEEQQDGERRGRAQPPDGEPRRRRGARHWYTGPCRALQECPSTRCGGVGIPLAMLRPHDRSPRSPLLDPVSLESRHLLACADDVHVRNGCCPNPSVGTSPGGLANCTRLGSSPHSRQTCHGGSLWSRALPVGPRLWGGSRNPVRQQPNRRRVRLFFVGGPRGFCERHAKSRLARSARSHRRGRRAGQRLGIAGVVGPAHPHHERLPDVGRHRLVGRAGRPGDIRRRPPDGLWALGSGLWALGSLGSSTYTLHLRATAALPACRTVAGPSARTRGRRRAREPLPAGRRTPPVSPFALHLSRGQCHESRGFLSPPK